MSHQPDAPLRGRSCAQAREQLVHGEPEVGIVAAQGQTVGLARELIVGERKLLLVGCGPGQPGEDHAVGRERMD
jgi:hypothetical protein